jgi:hypothetical protein
MNIRGSKHKTPWLTDNNLNQKNYVDQLAPKLRGACNAVGFMLHISNTDTLKSVYFAHFLSLMKNGIISYDD